MNRNFRFFQKFLLAFFLFLLGFKVHSQTAAAEFRLNSLSTTLLQDSLVLSSSIQEVEALLKSESFVYAVLTEFNRSGKSISFKQFKTAFRYKLLTESNAIQLTYVHVDTLTSIHALEKIGEQLAIKLLESKMDYYATSIHLLEAQLDVCEATLHEVNGEIKDLLNSNGIMVFDKDREFYLNEINDLSKQINNCEFEFQALQSAQQKCMDPDLSRPVILAMADELKEYQLLTEQLKAFADKKKNAGTDTDTSGLFNLVLQLKELMQFEKQKIEKYRHQLREYKHKYDAIARIEDRYQSLVLKREIVTSSRLQLTQKKSRLQLAKSALKSDLVTISSPYIVN